MKDLIIFDLDGTLAASKSPLDTEMAALLARLLEIVKVAVISGGAWTQFQTQMLSHLTRATPSGQSFAASHMRDTILSPFAEPGDRLYSEDIV